MRQTLAFLKFVVIFSSLSVFSAYAQTTDKQEAQVWLRKIQLAAQKLNYSGTFVYQQGNLVRTSRISHILDGKNEIEKLEVLDGKPREYIRNNDEIVYYVPEAKTLLIEKRVTQDIFPALLATNPADLLEYYVIKKEETRRIAGFDCQAIVLEPTDQLRYGYKLWAEKRSGLLLRAQTINENNVAIEQIAFTQISIGNIARSRVKSSFPNTHGWRVENAVMTPGNLSGWNIKGVPPGFKKIRELKRLVSDITKTNSASAANLPSQREIEQIVFSDGMAAISVFIESGVQGRTEGSIQQGAMNIMGKRYGDFWLTIVGEVPAAAIKQVANSIEFKSK